LVIDEVYYRQVFPGVEYTSFAELVENIPVIILCGVEKILGVPGWSTSWTVLFDKHNYLDEVRHNLAVASTIFLHSNKFTQISLPELLELEKTLTTDRFISVKENHDWLFNELEVFIS
jgi:aspartate/methionine/tyrosine aminotransferase